MNRIRAFRMDEVELKDAYCVNALKKETAYLLSFDADRLLAGFRETAGLDTKGKKRYGGWENMLIGGHTAGHYLSAMAQAYANRGVPDEDKIKIFEIVSYMVEELLVCQDNSKGEKGFIFGATFSDRDGLTGVEAQFDRVEHGKTNIITESWVPWYTMHKLFAGLISVYELMGECRGPVSPESSEKLNENTLKLLKGMGDWTCNRAFKWSEETRRTVVSIEYGGMNEVLYELYAITGEERYRMAGDLFDEPELYTKVASGAKDVLNNHHANTTIPKFIGAMNRYVAVHGKKAGDITRDETAYLEYAKTFWQTVVDRHTYITGGNSEWEHFGQDYVLNAERTACNNETCNVYNMLKLSRGLFMITGEKKYLDYYENTFYNSILSSQNPETGMTTYFQPMATGYFKTYGEPFTKFWCCTGSGMENFTKLNDSLYFYRGSDIFVNMYFDSVLNSAEHDLKLEIKTALPFGKKTCVKLTTLDGAKKTDRLKLIFKMPDWVDEPEKVVFKLNGTESGSATVIPGREWAVVEGEFADGDVIEFELPMKLKAAGLPDDERVFGLKYGPLVLSADLGRENMSTTITGVDVTVPARKIAASEVIVLPDGVNAGDFAKDPEKYVTVEQPEGEGASVTVIPAGSKLRFSAHFLRYRDRYGIYFYYLTGDEAREAAAEGRFGNTEDVDTVMPGYGQYENDELHAMLEKDTESVTSGATYRIAKAGGAFSYRMAVDRSRKNRIRMMLRLCDNRKPLRISADGTDLYNDNLAYRGTDQYYPFELELPGSVVAGAEHITANGAEYDVVTIAFSGTPEADSAAVCDFVKVVAY